MITTASYTGTGSDQDTNSIGLPYRHAFAVLGTVKLSDGTKLLKLRNPWGAEKYAGPWSDDSETWTRLAKLEAEHADLDDGVWFMDAKTYH